MNEMQVFQNSEFGSLGVLEINGKPHFPATACAKILGYAKPHNAIAQHCRYSLKQGVPHPQNPGKNVEMNFISEGDLYRLIVHSKLPAASGGCSMKSSPASGRRAGTATWPKH